MTLNGTLQLAFYVVVLIALAKPLGAYMARIYEGEPVFLNRLGAPFERLLYRVCGVDPQREMRWTEYAVGTMAFNILGLLAVYALQRFQGLLPLNPQDLGAVSPDSSFNTAVSFATNTNWQGYAGETTMSYLTQMLGLTVQNFVSAATGMAVLMAFVRGFTRVSADTIGNFWVDLVRTTVRILVPIAFVFAIVLVAAGVIQNTHGFTQVNTVAGATQKIPGGPNASMESIKMIGTNGGDFFNVNSAHPFSNPTKFSDFLEIYAILIIPFALAFTFGRMVKDKRQGYAVFSVMFVIWLTASLLTIFLEVGGNPKLDARGVGVTQTVSASSPGGNSEGKEVRYGPTASGLWAASTTGTSNGSVNSMHDSFTPAGGMVPLVHMKLGEVSPGGVGVGLNGLLILAILSVFIAGLMVGRTPEYLGKKIQAAEVKLVAIYILVMPAIVLIFIAISTFVRSVSDVSLLNPGSHGFTELIYAFTSAGNNNGSAFAGITANTAWMNTALAVTMLVGRFFLIIPTLALAGVLVRKRRVPPSAGTFPTHTPLFVVLVIGVVLIVAALTFLPVLALGPIVEQLGI
jgi:potassium-transporting ATPase potassium-binding subunit